MDNFGDLDNFGQYEVQGKPIKVHRNGDFENGKVLFIPPNWSWDDLLCAASQRLEMVPMAKRVYNADGTEIDDIMCIEDDDFLFFSTSSNFKAPSLNNPKQGNFNKSASGDKSTTFSGVVGGYKIGCFLGRGGFGEVRLGVHQVTNEQVALKFILKSEIGSLGDAERTTTEIHCLTALNHPHVIKLLRVLNEPNHVVLVFELLEGGDLFHYLKDLPSNGLPEDEGCKLFTQILQGVGYAHNQHICHRDLKLENILLANKDDINNVKIADFGLSDFYRPGAMMKTSCGSISYLAPEVFRGTSNAGPPLDVWSLGVILFAIICGRLPFEGSDLRGTSRPRENVIRNRIMRCQYKVDEHLSLEAKDLLKRMLKLDPNERATIPEIFNHCWIRGRASDAGDIIDIPPTPPSSEMTAFDDGDTPTENKMTSPTKHHGHDAHNEKTSSISDSPTIPSTPIRKSSREKLEVRTAHIPQIQARNSARHRNDRHIPTANRLTIGSIERHSEKLSPRSLPSPVHRKLPVVGVSRNEDKMTRMQSHPKGLSSNDESGSTARVRRRPSAMSDQPSVTKRSSVEREEQSIEEKDERDMRPVTPELHNKLDEHDSISKGVRNVVRLEKHLRIDAEDVTSDPLAPIRDYREIKTGN